VRRGHLQRRVPIDSFWLPAPSLPRVTFAHSSLDASTMAAGYKLCRRTDKGQGISAATLRSDRPVLRAIGASAAFPFAAVAVEISLFRFNANAIGTDVDGGWVVLDTTCPDCKRIVLLPGSSAPQPPRRLFRHIMTNASGGPGAAVPPIPPLPLLR